MSGPELCAGDTIENFMMPPVLEVLICQWRGLTSHSPFCEIRSSDGKATEKNTSEQEDEESLEGGWVLQVG